MKTLGHFIKDCAKPWQHWHRAINGLGNRNLRGTKYQIGYGGINCRCCSPMHPNKLKTKLHRYLRRKQKQQQHQ